jgi:hypothetical protein
MSERNKQPTRISKWGAAWSGFLMEVGAMAVATGIVAGAIRLFSKEKAFLEEAIQLWKGPASWIPKATLGVLAVLGAADGYARAKQHNQLAEENQAMRGQLNQTGEVLKHIAARIEQDSGDANKPRTAIGERAHEEKLQTESAERVLQ